MAESREPRTLGSTPGTTGTATHSTDTSSTNTGGTTSGIADRVREQATAQLATQKDKATDGLGSVAQAVRQTTQHLRDNQNETVARYAEQTAEQIERFSERLRNKDVGELMNDVQQLARRQPALFVGGAFALGLLGARFLKSSSPESSSYGYGNSGYGNSGYEGGGYGGGSYGTTGYGNTGYGGSSYGTPGSTGAGTAGSTDLTGGGLGTTDVSTTGYSSGLGESTQTQSTSTSTDTGENAYGNRVPGTSRKASTNKRTGNSSTEGL